MDLERLITALGPLEVRGGAPTDITDLAYDTREVRPGALFFCAPGETIDRHDLAGEAVERGAVALVVERPLDLDVPQLIVESARAAMPIVADEFFERPTEELLLVGVTGTNGKTTTAYLLHSIFDTAGMRPGLIGTIESRVGGESRPAVRTTPESIDLQRTFRQMIDAGDRSAVMEATSHGSVLGRLDRVRFKALAFTNLTQDHLDFHGSMNEYYEAKRRLFTEHEPAPAAAINIDDDFGKAARRRASAGSIVRRSSPTGCPGRRRPVGRLGAIEGRPARLRTDSDGATSPGPFQPGEHARRRRRGAPARRPGGIRGGRLRERAERSRAIRVRRRGTAVLGDRRLRAHAGFAGERPRGRPGS